MAGNDLEPLVFQLPAERSVPFSLTKDSGGGTKVERPRWGVEPNTLRQFIAFWGN